MNLSLRTAVAVAFLLFAAHSHSSAQSGCITGTSGCGSAAPEIDPSLAGSEAALLGGVILLIRGRRKS